MSRGVHTSTIRLGRRNVAVTMAGEGPPVVFLHGWGLSPQAYIDPLDALAASGRSIIAPALPGFGGSDALAPRNQNPSGVAQVIARLLDQVGPGHKVPIIGHSFGGGVGIALAAERPDLVESVMGICPVGGAGTGRVRIDKMVSSLASDAASRWFPRALASIGPNVARHPLAVASTAYHAWSADLVEEVWRTSQARVPVLLSFADADGVVSPGRFSELALPNLRVEHVAGKHSWLLTEPRRFAAMFDNHTAGTTFAAAS